MKTNRNMMMQCPSCDKTISKKAGNCPDCGHSFNSGGISMSDPVHVVGVILAIILAIGVVMMITGAM